MPSPPAQAIAAGFTSLDFDDEFTALSLSPTGNGAGFNWYPGLWYESIPTNISVASSLLNLQWVDGQTPANATNIQTISHDSANGRQWRHGYFECSMKWDVTTGAWPAFWLNGVADQNSSGADFCEIDVFEGQGADPTTYYATVHHWGPGAAHTQSSPNNFSVPGTDFSQFHTYGLLWTTGQVKMYFDNVLVATIATPAIAESTNNFLILSMGEGVDFTEGDKTGVTATTMNSFVDWVRVWQPGTTPTITTSSLPSGTVSTPYSQTLGVTGGTSPYTWAIVAGALPAGLTLNASTGVISGTPATGGTSSFTVRVTDNVSLTATVPLAITIINNNPASQVGLYSQYTLANLTSEVLGSLGDPAGVYWDAAIEVKNAINEALHEFSGTTSYWRKRVSTNLLGYGASSWVDLSKHADTAPYRSRTTTIDSIVKEIQTHFCEPGSGFSGAGMTAQFTITEILQSIFVAMNRFFLDAQLPLTVTAPAIGVIPPDGTFALDQSTVYVHRLGWRDTNNIYYNLFRSDEFAADSLLQDWQLNPATRPLAFSQLDSAPLLVQLIPPPLSSGSIELVAVSTPELPDYVTSMNIPDDFCHAVKYLAMVNLLTTDGETTSSLIAQYCSARYQQIITAAKLQRCVARVLINNKTVPLNPLATLDSTVPFWRNQAPRQIPFGASTLYDLLIFFPALSQPAGASLDLITTAPVLSAPGDFIQLGREEVQFVIDYAQHYLSLKMQGSEFQQTLPLFDDCQKLIGNRNAILANQGRYLTGAFDQPAADTAFNPNTYETSAAPAS